MCRQSVSLSTDWTVLVWIHKHTSEHISVFLLTGLRARNPEQNCNKPRRFSNILVTAFRCRIDSLASIDQFFGTPIPLCLYTITVSVYTEQHNNVFMLLYYSKTCFGHLTSLGRSGLWTRYIKPPTPTHQFLNLRFRLLHKSPICIIW
jgi:hypothetical protein